MSSLEILKTLCANVKKYGIKDGGFSVIAGEPTDFKFIIYANDTDLFFFDLIKYTNCLISVIDGEVTGAEYLEAVTQALSEYGQDRLLEGLE